MCPISYTADHIVPNSPDTLPSPLWGWASTMMQPYRKLEPVPANSTLSHYPGGRDWTAKLREYHS